MIIRTVKDRNYSVINNTVLRDERLSWRARGIAAFLLTQPDDWTINSDYLWKKGTEGRDAVRNALKELEDAGYIHRQKHQDKEGKWVTDLTLTEVPTTDIQEPTTENQSSENQSSVFQASYLSTNHPSTNKNSSRAQKPTAQPHPETSAIIAAYIEVRGKNGINYQKEGTFAKKIAKDGYNSTQVKGCYLWLKADTFWEDKPVTLDIIFKHMPEYVTWAEKQGIDTTTSSSQEATVIDVDWNAL